jgi:corrinoid protein of di/trimethylamine methyltransferase
MERQQILENLKTAIVEGVKDKVREAAQEAIDSQIDPLEAVEQGLSKGMEIIGQRFESGEAYLPELLMGADAFNSAMEILNPEIEAQKKEVRKAGKVLLGTVKGDVHDIGKNIVGTVLQIHGFEVVDIGVDNASLKIIEEAQKANVDVIALSALMTTTMPSQREVIEALGEKKVRDRYFVIVGGGPVTEQWANDIGADGYGSTAVQAVELVKQLIAQRG